MSWRYLTADAVPGAEGLAADEALMLHYGRGRQAEAEAALRLYTYRSHCALVGRYQVLDEEIDLAACEELGIEVGRRPTGGGAILMGEGQLGVALTTRAPAGAAPRELLRLYAAGVIAGLARLGLEASFRSKNDLEVGGRKIAGLGLYLDDHGALLFHASVLVDLDVPLMLQALRIPGAKLSDKAVRGVAERVTTVSRELGRPMCGADARDAIREGLAEAAGVELVTSRPDAAERERQSQLMRERYGAESWIHQQGPLRDSRGTAVLKTPEGFLRIYVGVHGDTIKSAMVAGDFNTFPAGLAELEAALRWTHAGRDRVTELTLSTLSPDDLGVEPQVVADAVWEATARALDRSREAHPVRKDGSCYYPEPEPLPEAEVPEHATSAGELA